MLTAESILKQAQNQTVEKVEVPEWGGFVYVRVMSGIERDRWELSVTKSMEKLTTANIRAALCAMTICDENGKRLFTDNQASQLGQKSSVALDRVFSVAKRINKLTDSDVEELEKNLEAPLREVSGSA